MSRKRSDLVLPNHRLAKTRRVLDRSLRRSTSQLVAFVQNDEDTGALVTHVTFDGTAYADMGSPATITVTIEPGDRLP